MSKHPQIKVYDFRAIITEWSVVTTTIKKHETIDLTLSLSTVWVKTHQLTACLCELD